MTKAPPPRGQRRMEVAMVFAEKTYVVRRWAGQQTAGGGFVEDNHGRVWRVLDSHEPSNSGTTGVTVGQLMPNGEIKPQGWPTR